MEPGEIQMMITRLRRVPPELRVALLLSAVTYMASDEAREILPKDFEFPDHVTPTTAKHVVILDMMARFLDRHEKQRYSIQPTAVWLGNVIETAFPHLNTADATTHAKDFQAFLRTIFGPNGQMTALPPLSSN